MKAGIFACDSPAAAPGTPFLDTIIYIYWLYRKKENQAFRRGPPCYKTLARLEVVSTHPSVFNPGTDIGFSRTGGGGVKARGDR